MVRNYIIALFLCSSLCSLQAITAQEKPRHHLEDILYDASLDNPEFKLCNGDDQVFQYFNIGNNIEIEGDKPALVAKFMSEYDASVSKESGLVRIRFIVNCNGETDRFRLLTSDLKFQAYEMDTQITDQLMAITKSVRGWKTKYTEDGLLTPVDYYQYLVFRIVDGEIIRILP